MARRRISKAIRETLIALYGARCGYCGCTPKTIHLDHIIPKRRGGGDNIENLMPACFSCNNYKHTLSLEGFRRELAQQVTRARENSVNFRLAERFGQIKIEEGPITFFFEGQHVEIHREVNRNRR